MIDFDFSFPEDYFGLIYLLREKKTGRCYVGQTIKRGKRLRNYWGGGKGLPPQEERVKTFDRFILSFCSSEKEMNDLEEEFIKSMNAHISLGGFNILWKPGNKALVGFKHSEESKLKMSNARRGTHPSEETRKKLSEAKRGRKKSPMPEKTKQKIRASKQGKPRTWVQAPPDEEQKRKISESLKKFFLLKRQKELTKQE